MLAAVIVTRFIQTPSVAQVITAFPTKTHRQHVMLFWGAASHDMHTNSIQATGPTDVIRDSLMCPRTRWHTQRQPAAAVQAEAKKNKHLSTLRSMTAKQNIRRADVNSLIYHQEALLSVISSGLEIWCNLHVLPHTAQSSQLMTSQDIYSLKSALCLLNA